MKTLVFKLFVIPFLIVSCSKNIDLETLSNKEVITLNKKQKKSSKENNQPNEENTYYEEDIHAFYINTILAISYKQKEELLLQIEEGNEELIEELERLQEEIKFNEGLEKLLFKIRPVFPGFPPPPSPCPKKIEKETRCRIPLTIIRYLLFSKQTESILIQIKTEEGDVISENSNLFSAENFEGLPATELLKEGFTGEVTLRITKNFAPLEQKLTYEVDAYIGE